MIIIALETLDVTGVWRWTIARFTLAAKNAITIQRSTNSVIHIFVRWNELDFVLSRFYLHLIVSLISKSKWHAPLKTWQVALSHDRQAPMLKWNTQYEPLLLQVTWLASGSAHEEKYHSNEKIYHLNYSLCLEWRSRHAFTKVHSQPLVLRRYTDNSSTVAISWPKLASHTENYCMAKQTQNSQH